MERLLMQIALGTTKTGMGLGLGLGFCCKRFIFFSLSLYVIV